MWSILLFIIMIIGAITTQSFSESKVVEIDQGRLRGFRYSGGNFFTFISVPYATAPPGKDRFKAPLPPPVWMHTYHAVETGVVCPQALPLPKIQEDCLIANIFVPDTNVTNLPVMVYVHGGSFVIRSGDFFRYTELLESKKLIVVTFNYRLGVHGFLCLGTKDVPGNAGMKDQIALLRWVQRNIASFGGNPNDVTLVGCSAGGSAIDLLTLSPIANGLFHKAIIESGVGLGLNSFQLNPTENAKLYAKALNFTDVDNIEAMEKFYKTASFELLTSKTDEIIHREDSTTLFSPCLERYTGTGEEMFLADTPWNILKRGKYIRRPLLFGFSEMEGLDSFNFFESYRDKMNENFANFLPGDLQFDTKEEKEEVAKIVKLFYFGGKRVCEETVLDYIDYFTDVQFVYPMLRSLDMRQEAGNETVYLFEYSYVDEHTKYVPYTNVRGAGHCSQGHLITDEGYTNITKEHTAMKNTMRNIWLNFIITGNPVPEGSNLPAWPPVNNHWSPHMTLNSPTPELKESLPVEQRVEFWDYLYRKYHLNPMPPTNGAMSYNHSFKYKCIVFVTTILRVGILSLIKPF